MKKLGEVRAGRPPLTAMADVRTPFPRRPLPSRVLKGRPHESASALAAPMLDVPHALSRSLSDVRREGRHCECSECVVGTSTKVMIHYFNLN